MIKQIFSRFRLQRAYSLIVVAALLVVLGTSGAAGATPSASIYGLQLLLPQSLSDPLPEG